MLTQKSKKRSLIQPVIAIYNSIEDVPPAQWPQPSDGSSAFLSPEYLDAFENNSPQNITCRYVSVSIDGKYYCSAYIQLIDVEDNSIGNFLKSVPLNCPGKYVQKRVGDHTDCIKIRLLVCGNIFISGEHGFSFDKEMMKAADASDWLNKMIDTVIAEEESTDPVSMVLIKDFYESSVRYSAQLKKKHFNAFKVDPNMILDIDPSWKKFDDYLSSLSSKYRVRAKSILKKGTDVIQKQLDHKEIKANEDKIMQLYMVLHDKARFKPAAYSIETFLGLKKAFKDRFVFTGYFVGEELVAFKSYFIVGDKKDVEAHFVGFDNLLNKKHELYQNILYHYIAEAIELGSGKILFGRTALEIKSNVGAKPHELVCYIKHVNPVFNFIIKPFIKRMQSSTWVMRDPFKNVAPALS